MTKRSDPFSGNKARLAYDLGKAWAWCEQVHHDLKPFTLVADVFDLGGGRFGVEPGIEETEWYFECGVIRETALAALGTLGYVEAPARWYSHYPTEFIFADKLSAHETVRAIGFFQSKGLLKHS
jgi:hypothetical protein